MRAKVAAVDDGGIKTSQEFEVSAPGPWLHNVQVVLNTKLREKREENNAKTQETKGRAW